MSKVDVNALGLFFENLGFLLDAGIDPLTAVTTLADCQDKATKKIASVLNRELTEGKDLSEAFSRHDNFFRHGNYGIYIAAGLQSGELPQVLFRLTENLNSNQKIKKQISSAMIYPAFLGVATIFVSIYMFTKVVPQIAKNINEITAGKELPAITKIAMNISNLLINHKFEILAGFVILIILIKIVFTMFRSKISETATQLPILGNIIIAMEMGNFYTNLAHMLSANISISESLTICANGAKNKYIKKLLNKQTVLHNERGYSLKDFMYALPFTTSSERQCIVVAENTGRLPAMFSKIAERKQKELQQTIKSLLTFVEPLMMLIMGGVIGSIVLAVYMPIMSMSSM